MQNEGMTNTGDDDVALAECRRLDAVNCRAVVPAREVDRIDGGDLPDVVEYEGPPALVYVPERYYPLPREYFDPVECDEFGASAVDVFQGRSTKAWGYGR